LGDKSLIFSGDLVILFTGAVVAELVVPKSLRATDTPLGILIASENSSLSLAWLSKRGLKLNAPVSQFERLAAEALSPRPSRFKLLLVDVDFPRR
jgi:hypothetical protein